MSEHQVRSKAVAWATDETLRALTDWFRYAAAHRGDLPLEGRIASYELIYRLVRSMRTDLELDTSPVEKDAAIGMVFSDYAPELHNPPAIRASRVSPAGEMVLATLDELPESGS